MLYLFLFGDLKLPLLHSSSKKFLTGVLRSVQHAGTLLFGSPFGELPLETFIFSGVLHGLAIINVSEEKERYGNGNLTAMY